MGYSCTKDAADTLDAIFTYLREKFPTVTKKTGKVSSNGWTIDGREYFFERGRENEDGAITGTVWLIYFNTTTQDERCHRVGSVRIESGGQCKRFPGVPKKVIADAILQAAINGASDEYIRRRSRQPLPL